MSRKLTTEEFIEKAKKIHGNKYDYSKINYINTSEYVDIFCKKCSKVFRQIANSHLNGKGCPVCADRKLTTEVFIKRAEAIHKNKYDYSQTVYVNRRTKLQIKCNTCDRFFTVLPHNHLKGRGCQCQRPRSNSENQIADLLTLHGITFERQKTFKDCKDKHSLAFDFYLPEQNVCIEFQGQQHYESVKYWGGEECFKDRQKKDKIKRIFCEQHDIKLVEIKYSEDLETRLNKEVFNCFTSKD